MKRNSIPLKRIIRLLTEGRVLFYTLELDHERMNNMGEKFKDTCSGEEFDSDDLAVQVCSSNAGYYVGQLEPCGAPFDRLSGYYRSYGDAEKALKSGWPSRGAEENKKIEASLIASGKLDELVECRRCKRKDARRIEQENIICPQCGIIKEKTDDR